MSVPIVAEPGATELLTVPYATDSYVWNGKSTTAQYYANDAGVSVEDGCVWGEPDGGKGNWAPLVFGAGVNEGGETFLSVFQNPLNPARANYNVKVRHAFDLCCSLLTPYARSQPETPTRSASTKAENFTAQAPGTAPALAARFAPMARPNTSSTRCLAYSVSVQATDQRFTFEVFFSR